VTFEALERADNRLAILIHFSQELSLVVASNLVAYSQVGQWHEWASYRNCFVQMGPDLTGPRFLKSGSRISP